MVKALGMVLALSFISFFSHSTNFNSSANSLLIFPMENDTLTVNKLVDFINSTQKTLDLTVYRFDEVGLIEAVREAANRGVKVRIIWGGSDSFQRDYQVAHKHGLDRLIHNNIQIRSIAGEKKAFAQTHYKMLVADGKRAILQTANLDTESLIPGKDPNFPLGARDFGYVVSDQQLIDQMVKVFEADWKEEPIVVNSASPLFWGPDNQRSYYIAAIRSAKKSIDIYQQDITDNGIFRALMQKLISSRRPLLGKKGPTSTSPVQIRLLIMPHSFSKEKDNNLPNVAALINAGAQVKFFPNDVNAPRGKKRNGLYMHAKAMLVDNAVLLLGSCNFYTPSLDTNRELGIKITDRGILDKFKNVFEYDWKNQSLSAQQEGHPQLVVSKKPLSLPIKKQRLVNNR